MEWMETLVLVVHVLVSVALIGLVLIQHGKGADAGAAFGSGASQTVFGSQGTGSFLTRLTTWFAVIFFITSFSLGVFAKQKAQISMQQGIALPVVKEENAPANEAEQNSATKEPVLVEPASTSSEADNKAPVLE
ncbi:MAG: preprotein translocase subunit SecG [Hahellaceae bacterium]|nr:preprotein translocase subunit SecG [Hahellaceae bacterium]MCP5168760.1 preprotein translocase subunit SecG [Hahellaceae bacterium]